MSFVSLLHGIYVLLILTLQLNQGLRNLWCSAVTSENSTPKLAALLFSLEECWLHPGQIEKWCSKERCHDSRTNLKTRSPASCLGTHVWSRVLLEEPYRLKPARSQVLRAVVKLGLSPRSTMSPTSLPGTWSNLLDQTSESKRLGHEKNEPNKTGFEGLHLKNAEIWSYWGTSSRQHQTYQ